MADAAKESKLKDIILKYFDFMNKQNVQGALSCLRGTVSVKFSDSSRNWSGLETAQVKFEGMFKNLPDFTIADYEFLLVESVDDATSGRVEVKCKFEATNYSAERKMVYDIVDGQISSIDHIDI